MDMCEAESSRNKTTNTRSYTEMVWLDLILRKANVGANNYNSLILSAS